MGMLEISTIFLGAFLLFLVQPMMGNALLPQFGGTATVWSVCLATFQILLVGGYCHAHLVRRGKGGRPPSFILHGMLLLVASCWLVCGLAFRTKVSNFIDSLPSSLGVFVAIVALVALPYIALSANSSLVQDIAGGRYGLYAVSNLGSLIGLWAYPLVFERYLPLGRQWAWFAALFIVYAVLFAVLMVSHRRNPLPCLVVDNQVEDNGRRSGNVEEGPKEEVHPICYLLLSALSCFLLNAVSTHLGSDITPLPFMWVALLSLYLFSYIVAFTDRGSKYAPLIGIVLVPTSIYAAWHMGLAEFRYFGTELVTSAVVLFMGGIVIHSMLYRNRPAPRHLTMYYLMIALGGALGGAVCSFVMPVVCNKIVEYPVAVALAAGVGVWSVCDAVAESASMRRLLWPKTGQTPSRHKVCLYTAIFVSGVAICGVARIGSTEGEVIKRYRNFYGVGCVAQRTIKVSHGRPYEANEFRCNGTTHGLQKKDGDVLCSEPMVYYAAHAGGLPLLNHPKAVKGERLRVAICGMGIGTMATYSRAGDFYRFYEINPSVVEIAKDESLFSFISSAKGEVDIVVDDARRALERERGAGEPVYDVIVVDVFTGDAIPPHMATEEAFSLYLDRLAPDGILAFHLSNWHLDLMPMVKAVATKFGLNAEAYYCASTQYAFESTWGFLSLGRLPKMFNGKCHQKVDFGRVPDVSLMTDERHSLLPYLQWNMN